jgi:hypothetical protein
MEFNGIVNKFLRKDPESRKRYLYIRTYVSKLYLAALLFVTYCYSHAGVAVDVVVVVSKLVI